MKGGNVAIAAGVSRTAGATNMRESYDGAPRQTSRRIGGVG